MILYCFVSKLVFVRKLLLVFCGGLVLSGWRILLVRLLIVGLILFVSIGMLFVCNWVVV